MTLFNYGTFNDAILQVLDIKRIGAQTDRYRLVLSDGQHYIQGMLATQIAHHVTDNNINVYDTIKLKKSMVNDVNGRRVVILLDIEVQAFTGGTPQQIGTPSNCDPGTGGHMEAPTSASDPYGKGGMPPGAAGGSFPSTHAPNVYASSAYPSAPPPSAANQYAAPPPSAANQYAAPPPSSAHPYASSAYPSGPQPSAANPYAAPPPSAANPYSAPPMTGNAGAYQPYSNVGSARPYGGTASYADTKPFIGGQQQQQPAYSAYGSRNGPVTPTRTMRANTVNISDLNPYMTNWQIKARVTSKGEMKKWSNAKGVVALEQLLLQNGVHLGLGEGNLFSFDVLDAAGGEIRITAFKQDADRFFQLIQIGQIYIISCGQLKVANRSFSHLKHEYEITLGRESNVEMVNAEDNSISQMHFDFVTIASIERQQPNAYVDVIGVVTEITPLSSIVSKSSGRDVTKRNITIIDDSNASIEVTIWGSNANEYDENRLGGNAIIAIKGARVSEYNGRTLSTVNSSTLVVRPDIRRAHELQRWFDVNDRTIASGAIQPMSKRGGAASIGGIPYKTCSEISLDGANAEDQSFFLITATINVLQFNNERPPWYLSCPAPDCKKKVTENGTGGFQCEKCNKSFPTCIPRYIFSFAVSDATGSTWLSVFHETGMEILGNRPAEDLRAAVDCGDMSTAESVFRDANFTEHTFKVRAKFDTYNDSSKLRCTVLNMLPIDHAAECQRLCQLISSY